MDKKDLKGWIIKIILTFIALGGLTAGIFYLIINNNLLLGN